MTLDANQILALAPDPASAKAGSQLAAAHHWSNLGKSDIALWGECQGSGKTPYKTQIDLNGPAFKCTCPSRKFPCKHGLGLYLLSTSSPALFNTAAEPQWVGDWLNSRQARQEKKADSAAAAAQDPAAAATAAAQARKREAKREGLPELTALMETVLLADLRDAVGPLMARIQDASAQTADLGLLLAALPPLVNVLRYGSARKVDTASLSHVVDGLAARACIALPYGVRGLADDAAASLLDRIIAADQALRRLQDEAHQAAWFGALGTAAASNAAHPMLSGRCARILTEHGEWSAERAAQQLALHCSYGVPPLAAAQWLEGFLQGSGALLAHSDTLWNIVNGWLLALPPDTFTELLPLLRRTVATFSAPERRELGERAVHAGGVAPGTVQAAVAVDPARAQRVLPILYTLLAPRVRAPQETVHDE